jgi:hypothetical protein
VFSFSGSHNLVSHMQHPRLRNSDMLKQENDGLKKLGLSPNTRHAKDIHVPLVMLTREHGQIKDGDFVRALQSR